MSLLSLLRATGEDEARALTAFGDWNPSRSATDVNEHTQYTLSAVWACQTLISAAIATMPVDVFRKTSTGRAEITGPGWVERPNPVWSKVDFDTQRVLSLLGWGNAYTLLIPGSAGLERWPVEPWRVNVTQVGYGLRYEIDGSPVDARRVQHIAGYRRAGDVKGMSVVEQARASMSVAKSAEDLTKHISDNGLNPSGVVEIPAMPAETAASVIERVSDKLRKWYAGPRNAGKPLVLTGGTSWKSMSISPVDAQFLETRKFQTSEIARWFRVPPHMIGDVEKTTSWGTGIEQQALGFVRFTLMPWIVRLEQADSALLPRPQFLKYNINALVRADLKTRYEALKMGREGGWLSANDVRATEDMPPIDNGDRYLEPLNYTEAGSEPPPSQAPA